MSTQDTSQEHELAEKIVNLLNQGTTQLDTRTTAKLLKARKDALARFEHRPTHTWMPAWVVAGGGRLSLFSRPMNLRAGLVLLALLGSFAGAVAWQTMSQQGSEIAEIDAGLLTDELPINAYLDKGFDSWLKRP
jgi:hypothetical protein